MAVPDFEKGGGKSVCGGSAAADGIFEDCRGGCSTTRIVGLRARSVSPTFYSPQTFGFLSPESG
ncbi:uncharacterized protein LACBIDRAFT_311107 [Laccaria bicolor S238N-H82]|uniref:Predicted protein n=1 Tax=Laccaria bicolor (strain S238N-H82 / ATCC MYA-4686) TaxID=486041 RepID=B0CZ93_LACBS|nr:uncharacterized protein LACBIDRAFT_311107 [Laccaria bicolor S238N-H82]EDR12111.1 predicted protein [Laccaria bicolor S238N-H82]|eukprot:XP_001876375.1 predicted protein [Laccaria bicolor S238N-H82]